MSMITVKNLWKTYGKQKVLQGLNLEVEKGETMVILGRSGAGKSVTLRLIMGLDKPDQGSVEVDGLPVSSMTQRERFRKIKHLAMLFQGSALFDSMTVGENTAFFLTQHPDIDTNKWVTGKKLNERVEHALEIVGLPGTAKKMTYELSGGMRRRVAIARLLVYRPKVILYDEPTTGLDPVTSMSINEVIRTTQKELQATSIVVTHDLRSAIEVGDKIAYHHEGRIIQVAPKNQFFQIDDPNVRAFLNNTMLPADIVTRSRNA